MLFIWQRLKEMNKTAFELMSQVDTLPSTQYSYIINTVHQNTVNLYNDTCVLSAVELDLLTDRYALFV